MPTIRIHVDSEEMAAIERRAKALGIKVEDLAYGALNCSMTHGKEDYCRGRVSNAIGERKGDLPGWSDSARSIGIYQSKPDIQEERGPKAPD